MRLHGAARDIPVLRAGPPPELAVCLYRVLCRDASEQRKQRCPEVRVTVGELARRAQVSRATGRPHGARVGAAGWLQVTRTREPGRGGGELQGRASGAVV
jgi:hypothetical protein